MKLFTSTAKLILGSILSLLLGVSIPAGAESFCIDFRWKPDQANLLKYDFSILDIQSEPDLGPGHAQGRKFYSYMCVGQIASDAPYFADVKARGIKMLSYDAAWDSYYPDLADPRWADYVVNNLAPIIVNKGFDGFFLDMVDSTETMMEIDPVRAALHYQGMVSLITRLKGKYPNKDILLNRGFVVFPSVQQAVKGMVVEELLQRYDYTARSARQVDQLLARIAPVTAAGKPVYIIDYVSPDNLALAEETARRIAAYGFHPAVVPQKINGTVLAPRPSSGLTPSAPAAPPLLKVSRRSRTEVSLTFMAQAGKSYRIESAAKPSGASWQGVGTIAAQTTTRLVESTQPSNGALRFYRVVAQ